jgi:hypothetical protein
MTWTEKGADDELSEILIRAIHDRLPLLAEHLEGSGSAAAQTNAQWKRGAMTLSVDADFSSGELTADLSRSDGNVSYDADGEMEVSIESYDLVREGEVRFPIERAFSKDAFAKAAGELAARLCEPDAASVLERLWSQQGSGPPAKAEP